MSRKRTQEIRSEQRPDAAAQSAGLKNRREKKADAAGAYICARCAAVSPTCCRMNPDELETCFPLSAAEAARLAPHAARLAVPPGVPVDNTKDFVRTMRFLFPDRQKQVRQAYPLPGEHMVLPVSRQGACMFLGDAGCLLPREARPWYCRLFPLWFRKGALDLFASYQCLVTREAPGTDQAMRVLGVSLSQAESLYQNLLRDWGLEPE